MAADAASKSDDYRCAKRLEAIASLEDLGAGFALATQIWRSAARVNCLAKNKAAQWNHRFLAVYGVAGKRRRCAESGREPSLEDLTSQQTEVELRIRRYCQMISSLT